MTSKRETAPNVKRLEWALHLASKGFRIFRIKPGTKGGEGNYYSSSWLDEATTDPETIKSWFEQNPDINYGVNPGEKYVVLDLDKKPDEGKDGFTELTKLEGQQDIDDWVTPDTWAQETPSGGRHLLLQSPYPVGNGHRFPNGIDVRGSHGYIVGPGSVVNGRTYKPLDPGAKIMFAPRWIMNHTRKAGERSERADDPLFELDTSAAISRARQFLHLRKPAIQGQNGDEHTVVTAMHLRDIGLSEEKAVEIMAEPDGWNDRCEPPWELSELSVKVANGFAYASQQAGSKAAGADVFASLTEGEDIQDVATAALEAYREESGNKDAFETLRAMSFRGRSILARDKRREMIVPGWLTAHGLTALNAERGTGKSVTMVDLALSIALKEEGDGRTWMAQPVADDWAVIYICGEDDEGLQENLTAWEKRHGEFPGDDRFIVMAGTVNLMSADSVETWTKYLKGELGTRRAVLFVDTWQRASAHAGQSKDEDMQIAVHHAEAMAKSLSGPVVAATHPSKHGPALDIMGSSVIANATTGIWGLENNDGQRTLTVHRIKGGGEGNYQLFRFETIGLGEEDAFGSERTGVVAARNGGVEDSGPSPEAERQKRNQERMDAAWAHAIIEACPAAASTHELQGATLMGVTKAMARDKRDVVWEEEKVDGSTGENLRRCTTADYVRKQLRTQVLYDAEKRISRVLEYIHPETGEHRQMFLDKEKSPQVIRSRPTPKERLEQTTDSANDNEPGEGCGKDENEV